MAGAFRDFQTSFYPESGLVIENARQPKKKIVRLDPDSSMPRPGPKSGQNKEDPIKETQQDTEVYYFILKD